MNLREQILANAFERKQIDGLAYAGAVTPQEAYALVEIDPDVLLVDVRTEAERDWIGTVMVPEAQYAEIQWSFYPSGERNPQFIRQLETAARKDQVILMICRSGVRSQHAASFATEHGFTRCYDVLEGVEGEHNEQGYRKTVNGWCKAGLPWCGA